MPRLSLIQGLIAAFLLFTLFAGVTSMRHLAADAAAPTRILPLGDSITQAETGHNSYRRALYQMLADAGYDVDFVGSMSQVFPGAPPPDPWPDMEHEGHWGWRADQIVNGRSSDNGSGSGKLADWLAGYTPDVALLHIGHNDLRDDGNYQNTLNEVAQIIQLLRDDNPQVIILLAQLIPSTQSPRDVRIPEYNDLLPGFAAAQSSANSPVIIVDQFTGFDVNEDTYDGTHPSPSGEQKMAQRWFEALEKVLAPEGTFSVYLPLALRP